MTTITIYSNNSVNGKFQIEVSDNTQLSGSGISKDKYCGNLNCYFATKNAIEKLKKTYTCNEISKW